MNNDSFPITILRWSLAFAFFYASIAALLNPQSWAIYFPNFLAGLISKNILVVSFSIFQLFLVIWLFIGKKIALASMASFIVLIAIVLFNFDDMNAVFGNISLALAALALFHLAGEEKKAEMRKSGVAVK